MNDSLEERKEQREEELLDKKNKQKIKKQEKRNRRQQVVKSFFKELWKKIPIKYRLIILGVIILLVILLAAMAIVVLKINGAFTETDTEYEASASNIISNMDINGNPKWNLTEEQIKSFIENYDTTNETLRNIMLDNISKIYKWQNDYGYSAAFIISLGFEDNRNDFDNYINEMNEKGKEWKTNGYKSVFEFIEDYIGDETSTEVANNIVNKISETGRKAEIITSGENQVQGDGYSSEYTSTSGRIFKNYKQIIESYKKVQLANYENSDFYNYGCAITSVSIISSGFGCSYNPIEMNSYYANTLGGAYHPAALSHFTGLTCYYVNSNIRSGVIQQLSRGYPVLVHVNANKGTFSTWYGHFFVILDISDNGKEVYVSDPASYSQSRNGWLPISILNDSAFNQYIKME